MGRMKIRKRVKIKRRVKIMGRVKIMRRVCNGVQVTTDWVFEALEAGEHYRWYVMIKISVSPCWSIGRLCWFLSYRCGKGYITWLVWGDSAPEKPLLYPRHHPLLLVRLTKIHCQRTPFPDSVRAIGFATVCNERPVIFVSRALVDTAAIGFQFLIFSSLSFQFKLVNRNNLAYIQKAKILAETICHPRKIGGKSA